MLAAMNVPKNRWKACPKYPGARQAQGLRDEIELQSYFIKHRKLPLLSE